MKLFSIFRISFLSLFSCSLSWSADMVMLKPEHARLTGARLKDHNGVPAICCLHSKGFEARWDVDVPEAGTYIVELEFGCPGPNSGQPFEFNIGKTSFVWTSAETAGWWEYQRRHIQKVKLEKGPQFLSVTPQENRGINISFIRLIPEPGFVVSPSANGVLDLKPERADLTISSLYPNNVLSRYGETAGWNLSLPEAGKYKVFINYAGPSGGKLELQSPSGCISAVLPGTGKWEKFEEREIGDVSLSAGESKVTLKKPNGALEIMGVRLVNAEVAEKAMAELRSRPRVGMSLEQLETVWGASQECHEVPTIDRKGGKEDVDWELYKEAVPFLKSRVWQKPGMKIIAYFFKDRCVGLTINPDVKEIKTAYELAGILMPGVVFKRNPGLMTIYSSDGKYKFQYWGSYFEIKDSGTLSTLKGKGNFSVSAVAGKFLIGKTLPELQKILGPGTVRADSNIDRRGDQNDVDWSMYRDIRPATTAHLWIFPDKDNLNITAIFLRDKCIALDISKKNGFSTREIADKVREFLPGITFSSIPSSSSFTIYSTNFERGFKLQNWGYYFEIKASGMVRQTLKNHETQLQNSALKLINVLKNCEVLKKKSMFGQTRQELDDILGASTESPVEYCGRPTCVWKFPEGNWELYGSFEKSEKGLVCSHMTIVDCMRRLPVEIAFPVARQMIAPYKVDNPSNEKMKSWFSLKSQERGNRFLIEWYDDPHSRASLRITDKSSGKDKEKSSSSSQKRGLDEIRKIL